MHFILQNHELRNSRNRFAYAAFQLKLKYLLGIHTCSSLKRITEPCPPSVVLNSISPLLSSMYSLTIATAPQRPSRNYALKQEIYFPKYSITFVVIHVENFGESVLSDTKSVVNFLLDWTLVDFRAKFFFIKYFVTS